MKTGQGATLRKHPEIHPYLVTRVVPTLYHIILLPQGDQGELIEIARTQMSFNKLECCLVLSPRKALYLYPNGSETRSYVAPIGGVPVHDRLRPCKPFWKIEN